MSTHRIATLVAAIVFLLLALGALFRLMFGFGLVIAGFTPGPTISFLAFVIFAGLSLMLFRGSGNVAH